ncbi:hypothetical protein Tco_1325370 [Tanacetum coccineum]
MYNQYDTTYGSKHDVGSSSSQHNVGGSSSQPLSFQSPFVRTPPSKMSRHKEEDEPAPVKKTNRNAEEPQCVPSTIDEEFALCRSCGRISEDNVVDNVYQTARSGVGDDEVRGG